MYWSPFLVFYWNVLAQNTFAVWNYELQNFVRTNLGLYDV